MRFHVPQYIEVENKLFGPLTLKQFIYIAGGVGGSVALWFLVPYRLVAIVLIVPVALLAGALAFYKVNEKPFIEVLEAAFYYATGSKLFIWDRRRKKPSKKALEEAEKKEVRAGVPRLGGAGKLKSMTWNLDVGDGNGTEEREMLEKEEQRGLTNEQANEPQAAPAAEKTGPSDS
ncbi:MAG: PrgI family protein [Candidatus Paceibacterota bacterium]